MDFKSVWGTQMAISPGMKIKFPPSVGEERFPSAARQDAIPV